MEGGREGGRRRRDLRRTLLKCLSVYVPHSSPFLPPFLPLSLPPPSLGRQGSHSDRPRGPDSGEGRQPPERFGVAMPDWSQHALPRRPRHRYGAGGGKAGGREGKSLARRMPLTQVDHPLSSLLPSLLPSLTRHRPPEAASPRSEEHRHQPLTSLPPSLPPSLSRHGSVEAASPGSEEPHRHGLRGQGRRVAGGQGEDQVRREGGREGGREGRK